MSFLACLFPCCCSKQKLPLEEISTTRRSRPSVTVNVPSPSAGALRITITSPVNARLSPSESTTLTASFDKISTATQMALPSPPSDTIKRTASMTTTRSISHSSSKNSNFLSPKSAKYPSRATLTKKEEEQIRKALTNHHSSSMPSAPTLRLHSSFTEVIDLS